MEQVHPYYIEKSSMAIRPKMLDLNFSKLLLLFVIGSVVGLGIEVAFHAAVFGGYESRAGLVWGPFSPLYGFGAVALTVLLNQLSSYPPVVIFLISMVVGSVIEFACSWWMEICFGAIAWDYSGTFGSIQGRVNFVFACIWGTLGLAWAKLAMPVIKRGFERIDWDSALVHACSIVLTVFLAINIVTTLLALDRESSRVNNVPASTPIDHLLDQHFPSSWMQQHFENMSIYGKVA